MRQIAYAIGVMDVTSQAPNLGPFTGKTREHESCLNRSPADFEHRGAGAGFATAGLLPRRNCLRTKTSMDVMQLANENRVASRHPSVALKNPKKTTVFFEPRKKLTVCTGR